MAKALRKKVEKKKFRKKKLTTVQNKQTSFKTHRTRVVSSGECAEKKGKRKKRCSL